MTKRRKMLEFGVCLILFTIAGLTIFIHPILWVVSMLVSFYAGASLAERHGRN